MRFVILLIAVIFSATPALAKIPHTVDFNRGADDSVAGRAPEYVSRDDVTYKRGSVLQLFDNKKTNDAEPAEQAHVVVPHN